MISMANHYYQRYSFLLVLSFFLIDTSAQAAHYEILAFGDSLTQGLKRDASGVIWAFPNPVYGARTGGYEPRLESLFSSQSGHTAFVYNWGVGVKHRAVVLTVSILFYIPALQIIYYCWKVPMIYMPVFQRVPPNLILVS